MKKLKLSLRIALGFAALILISVILGGIAVYNMKKVGSNAESLAREYVPEVQLANNVERTSYKLMYEMRGYGFTEEDHFLKSAKTTVKELDQHLDATQSHSTKYPQLTVLARELGNINKAVDDYKGQMKDTEEVSGRMDEDRQNMDNAAVNFVENVEGFFKSQQDQLGSDVDGQLAKIQQAVSVVNAGTKVRVANFKAQADNNPAGLQQAINLIGDIYSLVNDLRKDATEEGMALLQKTYTAAQAYDQAMEAYLAEWEKGESASETTMDRLRGSMDTAAGQFVASCENYLEAQYASLKAKTQDRAIKIANAKQVVSDGGTTRVLNFKSQTLRSPALMNQAIAKIDEIQTVLDQTLAVTKLASDRQDINNVKKAAGNYQQAMRDFLANWEELQALNTLRTETGQKVLDSTRDLARAGVSETQERSDDANTSLSQASYVMIWGLFLAIILGIGAAIVITLGITKAIQRIIGGLTEASEQVASASGEVSTASQQLAEGASQQAAGIEETSSSLEELSSMTRQNAENADQANNSMNEANMVVSQANQAIIQLTQSMEEISASSEETQKIVKTIDEIAFQTNILALNAAVEAARAGEAGAGFAVVADEVRNLAQRAAEAARNTADLIDGSVQRIRAGSSMVKEANEAFTKVAHNAEQVGTLVTEIANASQEQARGLDQINKAVAEMDKVVQQNASNAEESAAAAEEMNAQAQQMEEFVGDLIEMVEGSRNGSRSMGATSGGRLHLSSGRGSSGSGKRLALQSSHDHADEKFM